MEAKHTPGPWSYRDDSGYCAQIDGSNGAVICCFDQDPHDADARLITAAPELLEALKDAINRIKSSLKLLNCDDEFIDREIAKARSAIAKATS